MLLEVVFVLVFGLLALIPITLIVGVLIYVTRAARITVGKCQHCDYDLQHVAPGVRHCPECGHPFQYNARGDAISRP